MTWPSSVFGGPLSRVFVKSASLVLLGVLSAFVTVFGQIGDLRSSDLFERIEALRGLAQDPAKHLKDIVGAFEAEPRSVNWKPGTACLKTEAITAISRLDPTERKGVLLAWLGSEWKAANEDLYGGYVESPQFAEILLLIVSQLAEVGDEAVARTLEELVEEPRGWLPAGLSTDIEACLLRLGERAGDGSRATTIRSAVGRLRGRYPSKVDRNGTRGLTREARLEYGAQRYLVRLGLEVAPELERAIWDSRGPAAQRAETAYVLATCVEQAVRNGSGDARIVGEYCRRLASALHSDLKAKDSYYVDDAESTLINLPLEKLPSQVRDAIQEMGRRSGAAELDMTLEEVATRVTAKRALKAQEAEQVSERAQRVVGELEGMTLSTLDAVRAYLRDAEAPVRQAAAALLVRTARQGQARSLLRQKIAEVAELFNEFHGDLATLTALSTAGGELSKANGGTPAGNYLVSSLLVSEFAALRSAAASVVFVSRNDAILNLVRPLLADKNSWVRRCAEETFEEFGYHTWRGQIVGKVRRRTSLEREPISHDAERDFRDGFAKAVARTRDGDEKGANQAVKAISGCTVLLVDLISDSKHPIEKKKIALRAITENGSKAAIEELLQVLRESDDEALLAAVAEALSGLRNPEALPALMEAIVDGTDSRLDSACSLAVARMPGERPAQALLKAYTEGVTDDGNRDVIANGIAAIEAPEATEVLASVARQWADDRLGRAVVVGLASIGSRESVGTLFDLVEAESVSKKALRIKAVCDALRVAVSDYPQRDDVLGVAFERLRSKGPAVRRAAAEALAEVKENPEVKKHLLQAQDAETHQDVLRAIRAALRD